MSPERHQRFIDTLKRRQTSLTVVMENVHKPHNFSAIVRSCEAVGVHRAHAVYPEGGIGNNAGTTVGAHKWVQVDTHRNIQTPFQQLKAQGFQLLTAHLDETAVDFREVDYTQPTAVVMGSELHGISEEAAQLADHSIVIPMLGLTESLNVSVATALILFEAQRQRQLAGMYEQPELDEATRKTLMFEWAYPDLARRYQSRGEPYPELDDEGYLVTQNSRDSQRLP
ncbi:tRNA (guanosine-2-O)-methyltransferase [gamma proteobacterium HTCC5015]|nr:tRNA (guanosine-2-O)-methyltransferase [gamma proteobacterium HTCC5015]